MAGRAAGKTASTVGMMEGAFFVSRTDLLQWVNGLLQLSLTKVEQCASGAVYCQILDSCHPGTVAMRKVNWMAKSDHEFIPNYKVLQMAFDKNCIERYIDVDKLIRAKYQDNLEFLQWMKCYWERKGSCRRDYEPLQAREGKPTPPWARAVGGVMPIGGKENLRPRPLPKTEADPASKRPPASGRSPRPTARTGHALGEACSQEAPAPRNHAVEELKATLAAKQEELEELRGMLEGLESERDYYFNKLRGVEIVVSTHEANMQPDLTAEAALKKVQAILYSGDDNADADEGEAQDPLDSSNNIARIEPGPEFVEQTA